MDTQLEASGYFDGDQQDRDREFAERNAHIPSDEIQQDIQDTVQQIYALERDIQLLEQSLKSKRAGIRVRVSFIVRLRRLLNMREGTDSGGPAQTAGGCGLAVRP